MTIDAVLQAELTPEQYSAAVDPNSRVLALACAGSGKSRTLAYRIARLIDAGADPKSILAFTFTDKAAESIKNRVADALQKSGLAPTLVGAIFIGTIHSYCQFLLSEIDARYRQFDILDENKLKLYLISRYPQLRLQDVRTSRSTPTSRVPYFDVINETVKAWQLVNDELIDLQTVASHDQVIGNSLLLLRDSMNLDHFIDFSMMIRLVVEHLQANNPRASAAVAELRHVMVDEYQDINPGQEELIRLLEERIETLFVVGDDDQSIYAWRGADVSNIINFSQRYPGCAVHQLPENFRSTDAIVAASDAFVAAELGPTRITKNPRAHSNPAPRDFRALWFQTRADEATWVSGRIDTLMGTQYVERNGQVRGLAPSDFAILMRSTRTAEPDQTTPRHLPFTTALNHAYTLEAGGSIFERPQVAALRATFELLRSGIPTRDEARSHFNQFVLPTYPVASFDRFAEVMRDWGSEVHGPATVRRRVYPQALVHQLLEAFGITQSQFDEGTWRDIGVFSRMIQDVESVYVSIDTSERYSELLNFLANIAENGYDTTTQESLSRPDTITVSTVHKMKGLEFPVVFIVDAEAQRFPRNRGSYDGWLPQAVVQSALNRGAYQSTRPEEARLFYTALTRAERFLYVTGSASVPGGSPIRPRRPSAFTQRLTHPELSDDQQGVPGGLIAQPSQPRVDEATLPTSYSDIKYYLRCPKDYQFRKVYGFSPPVPDLFGFGMSVHSIVGKLHEEFSNSAPSPDQAEAVAAGMFHLKHVPESNDPLNHPGPYERARESAVGIARTYVDSYATDFTHERQLEVPFEVPVQQGVISGSIDLLLRYDARGQVIEASVIDFKSMDGGPEPEDNEALHWTELALQVQLYVRAASEILGENAKTGAVHLLRSDQRVDVPVTDAAVGDAVANVEWAIERVIAQDFPMRPHPTKCQACDFKSLCPQTPQDFATAQVPPAIHTPGQSGSEMARAFSEYTT